MDKPLTINDLQDIICNKKSEFRQRVSEVIANPRLIREVCPCCVCIYIFFQISHGNIA